MAPSNDSAIGIMEQPARPPWQVDTVAPPRQEHALAARRSGRSEPAGVAHARRDHR